MDRETLCRLIELEAQKVPISKIVEELGCGRSPIARRIMMIRYHGAKKVLAHYDSNKKPSQRDVAAIVERMYIEHLSVERASALYLVDRKRIERMMRLRQEHGEPIFKGVKPAALPACYYKRDTRKPSTYIAARANIAEVRNQLTRQI